MAQKTDSRGQDTPRREFGRDGVTGMVNRDRAIRAREVSQPTPNDYTEAESIVEELLSRVRGQRKPQSK